LSGDELGATNRAAAGPVTTDLSAVLALAAHGWSVIPVHAVESTACTCGRADCPSPGKHPRVRWDRWMGRAATPAELEAWWARWPDANIGVVTGWVSGLVVLDVDPRHGGDSALETLEARHGPTPDTVGSLTGGGGRHLFFAHPPHLVPSRPLATGLDLKAEGGMVVVPPSRHASGARYRWRSGHAPGELVLAPLPDWLDRLSVTLDRGLRADRPPPVVRTPTERAEFAELWAEAGVDAEPGDVMVRCPFHDDHRPSLHVDGTGCRWFCFGCRRGGGVQALRRLIHPEAASGTAHRRDRAGAEATGPTTLAAETLVDVVGESAHQDALLAITGGRRTWSGVHHHAVARLVPDDDNPYDPNAIGVLVEDRPVGHLPREVARAYRPTVEDAIVDTGAATCRAEIRGGWERGHGDVGCFGVVVRLPRLDGDARTPGEGAPG
jgi:hypothetical protein